MASQQLLLPRDVFEAIAALPDQPKLISDFVAHQRSMEDDPDEAAFVQAARDEYCDDDIEVDLNPMISRGDDGAFVNGWLWVSNERAGIAPSEEAD